MLNCHEKDKESRAYAITVKEVLERTVCVYADDLDDAIDKVKTAYEKCDIVLDYNDFYGNLDVSPNRYAPDGGDITDIITEYDNYQWINEQQ